MTEEERAEALRKEYEKAYNASVESQDPVKERARLERFLGKGTVFDTEEMQARFEVIGFRSPFVTVRERATGQLGSLAFQHSPRFYMQWRPHLVEK